MYTSSEPYIFFIAPLLAPNTYRGSCSPIVHAFFVLSRLYSVILFLALTAISSTYSHSLISHLSDRYFSQVVYPLHFSLLGKTYFPILGKNNVNFSAATIFFPLGPKIILHLDYHNKFTHVPLVPYVLFYFLPVTWYLTIFCLIIYQFLGM